MPLEPKNEQHLQAAVGFSALEMFVDADQELECIDPEVRHLPEVLEVRSHIYRGASKWDLMLVVAKRLAEYDPTNIDWLVDHAYARATSRGTLPLPRGSRPLD